MTLSHILSLCNTKIKNKCFHICILKKNRAKLKWASEMCLVLFCYTKIPIPLKRATHKNNVKEDNKVVHTTTCPASSASPFIWSAMETVATASEAANKENKAVYSAPEKDGIPKIGGRKIAAITKTA